MKKIVIGLIAALGVYGAQASYLAWQVGENESGYTYDNANIYAVDGSGTSHLLGSFWANSDPEKDSATTDIKTPMQAPAFADLSTYGSGYSYYIELSNYHAASSGANQFVAVSNPTSFTTYSDLLASGAIRDSLPNAALANIVTWHPTTYGVPEPTSAILMLFGAAFLGLKRKNRSLA